MVKHVTSTAAVHPAAVPKLRVHYLGPRTLRGRVVLRAQLLTPDRPVAITFLLAGRPLGTVTQPPWTLDLDAALLARTTGQLTVAAVDGLGHRGVSHPVGVRVLSGGDRIVQVSSQHEFDAVLPALRAGRVRVRLAPGTYRVRDLVLGPRTRLSGSGPTTVLRPVAGATDALVHTRAHNIRLSDLTVDGQVLVRDGLSIGGGARNVRVSRIAISRVRENAVSVWGPHSDVSIQDSTFFGGRVAAGAGVLDQGSTSSSDTSVIRTRIRSFVGYGVLFAQRFNGQRTAARRNLALDNSITDIVDRSRSNGTDAGGIWTGGVNASIIGNNISDTGTDGIETVGSSNNDAIIANHVSRTPVGIYIEHSTNRSLVAQNRIANVRNGINVEWRHAGGGSNANSFANNHISSAQVGVFVDVQDDENSITGNLFQGVEAPVVLQGSSRNLVQGNVVCGTFSGSFVVEQAGLSGLGAAVRPNNNRMNKNTRSDSCPAR